MIKVLKDAHQDVPPELERYAYGSFNGKWWYCISYYIALSNYTYRSFRRYRPNNTTTGSNSVPVR